MEGKSRKYCLIGVMVLAAVTVDLTGCKGPAQMKKEAAEALEQKYHEQFEVLACKEGGLFKDYYMVQAYSVEYPDLIFEASIEDKSGAVMDGYVTKRLCDRISEKISQNLGKLENDYYIFTEAMFSESLVADPEILLEEYVKKEPGNEFTIYLCMDKNGASVENIVAASVDMMNGISGISGSVSIYLLDTELLADIQEYVTSHDTTYAEFDDMTDEARVGCVPFENGGFCLTEENFRKMAGDRL